MTDSCLLFLPFLCHSNPEAHFEAVIQTNSKGLFKDNSPLWKQNKQRKRKKNQNSSDVVHEGDIFEEMGQTKRKCCPLLSLSVSARYGNIFWEAEQSKQLQSHKARNADKHLHRLRKINEWLQLCIIFRLCLIAVHVMTLRRMCVDWSNNKLNNSNNNVLKSLWQLSFTS